MLRKVLMLTAIVLVLSASQLQAAVINSSWVGGQSGNWQDASNWNPAIVPDNDATNTFDVTIDSNSIGVDEVLVWLQQERTINRLDCSGSVQLMQGGPYRKWVSLTLVDVNGLTNHDELYIEDDITIVGNVTNATGAYIEFGEAGIVGDLYNLAGATFRQEYEAAEIDGNATNAGVILIDMQSSFITNGDFHNAGNINIYGGEFIVDTMDNNSTGTIQGFGVLEAEPHPPLIQNKGKIIASGGTLTVLSQGPVTNTGTLANKALATLHIQPANDVSNNGTIEINAAGGVAFDCNLVNEPNAAIRLLGGSLAAATIIQTAGANFAGFGSVTGNIGIAPNASIELTGPTNIVGNVFIAPNATLEISDGTTLITDHCACDNGTIHMKGGRLIPQGGFTNNNCNIVWQPGVYNNIADFNLDGLVNFEDFAYFADVWLWEAEL